MQFMKISIALGKTHTVASRYQCIFYS